MNFLPVELTECVMEAREQDVSVPTGLGLTFYAFKCPPRARTARPWGHGGHGRYAFGMDRASTEVRRRHVGEDTGLGRDVLMFYESVSVNEESEAKHENTYIRMKSLNRQKSVHSLNGQDHGECSKQTCKL